MRSLIVLALMSALATYILVTTLVESVVDSGGFDIVREVEK